LIRAVQAEQGLRNRPAIEDVLMQVADENIIRFECFSDRNRNFNPLISTSLVYAAQSRGNIEDERDGRGLIIAILMCMACWAALGYFLLA
jgi:hypothetical protein